MMRDPEQQPPDRDGTAWDGDNVVRGTIWIGAAWAALAGVVMGAVVFGLLYLFCAWCRSIW